MCDVYICFYNLDEGKLRIAVCVVVVVVVFEAAEVLKELFIHHAFINFSWKNAELPSKYKQALTVILCSV